VRCALPTTEKISVLSRIAKTNLFYLWAQLPYTVRVLPSKHPAELLWHEHTEQ
jgi:hypothetical protein